MTVQGPTASLACCFCRDVARSCSQRAFDSPMFLCEARAYVCACVCENMSVRARACLCMHDRESTSSFTQRYTWQLHTDEEFGASVVSFRFQ